jgi:glycosyltransferase involved in cell wall biosynthesis
MTLPNLPLVSVIIPVFNDGLALAHCLEALAHQSYPVNQLEIIVIDNGSDPLATVQQAVAPYPQVRLVQELTPGSYAARNRGLALAQGEVIAFTDADCIPAPDWIERGVGYLQADADCGMVVGQVAVFPQDPQHPSIVDLYQMQTAFPQERYLKIFKGGATANVLTRRRVIDRVGPFNDQLKSMGDLEWGERVFRAGFGQRYAEDVLVRHPTRPTWAALRQRTLRTSGGVYDRLVRPRSNPLDRYRMLARLLVDDGLRLAHFTRSIGQNPGLKTWPQRLGVWALDARLHWVSAIEKIRLELGGVSHRM